MYVDYKLIGIRIKAARNRMGITQEILAEKLDVSIGYISQVERGITKISLDLLGAISTVLSCDVADLVTECAISNNNYIGNELMTEISKLDGKKRKFALDFIKLLSESNI